VQQLLGRHQGANSSIFYVQLFCMKMLCALFLELQFGFVILWCKNISAEAACKMLIKLMKGI